MQEATPCDAIPDIYNSYDRIAQQCFIAPDLSARSSFCRLTATTNITLQDIYRKRDFCGDTRSALCDYRLTSGRKKIVNFCSMQRAMICKRAKPIRVSRRRIGVKVERVTLLYVGKQSVNEIRTYVNIHVTSSCKYSKAHLRNLHCSYTVPIDR